MRRVTDLIRIMLNGEEDRHKLEFINGLMREHVGLEEKYVFGYVGCWQLPEISIKLISIIIGMLL